MKHIVSTSPSPCKQVGHESLWSAGLQHPGLCALTRMGDHLIEEEGVVWGGGQEDGFSGQTASQGIQQVIIQAK